MSLNAFACVVNEQQRAGENLEYDNLYLQMEDLSTNSEASLAAVDDGSVDGGGVKQADYKTLLKVTSTLLERTRDFRVATFYTIALTATRGFQGLLSGLQVLIFMSSELWEESYPQLDPDDDLDPTERLNILAALSPNSINDPYNFLTILMHQRVCPPLPLSSRDIKIAKGMINTDADSDLVLLKGQVLSLPEQTYADNYQLVSDCLQAVLNLEQSINAQLTDGSVLSLEKLRRELSFILHFFDEARGQPVEIEAESMPSNETTTRSVGTDVSIGGVTGSTNLTPSMPQGIEGQAVQAQALAGQNGISNAAEAMVPMSAYMQLQMQVQQLQMQLQNQAAMPASTDVSSLVIESRKDALALIEKCRAYFQKKEPTSPVPFLLQRALNMADMNFIQLLGEIDSSALERGREQLGVKENSED